MSSAGNQNAPHQKPLEQRLQEAARRAEEELHRLVNYLDTEVVPEVRRNSSTALRAAAVRLQKLAENLDNARSTDTPGKSAASAEGAGKSTSGPGPKPPSDS
jgi:hypothetical protein